MSFLRDIAVFLRVVQLNGFAAAGRDLGLTAPSVSKQIARLEAELGVALLHRTTHNLFLTDAGTEFYQRCVSGLAHIEEARAAAQSFNVELKGKIRLHATLSVGQALIAPALIDFLLQHPDIHVELEVGSPINPMEHQIDVAILTRRASRDTGPGHVSIGRRVLGRVHQEVVAAPSYLARAGRPETLEALRQHRCLVYITQSTSSENWLFQDGRQDVTIRVEPVLRSNNWYAIREAAAKGVGIARLPDYTVRQHIEAGKLVPLFEDKVRSDQQLIALFPKSQRMPAKVRLLLDFLGDRFGRGNAGPLAAQRSASAPAIPDVAAAATDKDRAAPSRAGAAAVAAPRAARRRRARRVRRSC